MIRAPAHLGVLLGSSVLCASALAWPLTGLATMAEESCVRSGSVSGNFGAMGDFGAGYCVHADGSVRIRYVIVFRSPLTSRQQSEVIFADVDPSSRARESGGGLGTLFVGTDTSSMWIGAQPPVDLAGNNVIFVEGLSVRDPASAVVSMFRVDFPALAMEAELAREPGKAGGRVAAHLRGAFVERDKVRGFLEGR